MTGALHAASLTPADRVTLTRGAMVGVLALLLLLRVLLGGATPSAWAWTFLAVAGPALLLDAVDGAVARRTVVTARGARLDEETDALAVAVLALAAAPVVGWWVLAAGALRYVYVAAGRLLPPLRAPLPFSQARRVVAGLQGPALLSGVAPGVPTGLAAVLCAAALTALAWSFGRDVAGQLRRAYRRSP